MSVRFQKLKVTFFSIQLNNYLIDINTYSWVTTSVVSKHVLTSLTSRDTLKKIPKPIIAKLYSACFNCKNFKLKDQAILKIFYVKESSNLIGRENFGGKTQEPDC